MSTLTKELSDIWVLEAKILLNKYLELVEDLEDYLSIKKHVTKKMEYSSEEEVNNLFNII